MSKKTIKISDNTWLIKDYGYCYLAVGRDKAAVIDTGLGLRNIAKDIRALTDKPLIVFNTHGHYDHFGNNGSFGEVHIHKADVDVAKLHNSEVFRKASLSAVSAIARPFLGKTLKKVRLKFQYVREGDSFDLGGRILEVFEVPGHTKGSIMLLDRANRMAFTGDTLVPRGVLLNLDYSLPPRIFRESMLKIKGLSQYFDITLSGHHELFPKTPELIQSYLELADKAIAGTDYKLSFHKLFGFNKVFSHDGLSLCCKVIYD